MSGFWYWLPHILGLDDAGGRWYLFWSGIGSDLTEFAILGGLFSVYWRHTCHVDRCWRLGRHPVDGTNYVTCQKHHPTGPPSHEEVLRQVDGQ